MCLFCCWYIKWYPLYVWPGCTTPWLFMFREYQTCFINMRNLWQVLSLVFEYHKIYMFWKNSRCRLFDYIYIFFSFGRLQKNMLDLHHISDTGLKKSVKLYPFFKIILGLGCVWNGLTFFKYIYYLPLN